MSDNARLITNRQVSAFVQAISLIVFDDAYGKEEKLWKYEKRIGRLISNFFETINGEDVSRVLYQKVNRPLADGSAEEVFVTDYVSVMTDLMDELVVRLARSI